MNPAALSAVQRRSSDTKNETKHSTLGRLPYEITEKILEYVVTVPQSTIEVSFPAPVFESGGIVLSSWCPLPLPKTIFHVNHGLRYDSLRALLRSNEFTIYNVDDMENMSKWLAKVPDGFTSIRSLKLGLRDFCNEPASNVRADIVLIHACSGLKELQFALAVENVVDFLIPGSLSSYQTFGKWRPPRPLSQLIQLFDVDQLLRLLNLKKITIEHPSGTIWGDYATERSTKLAEWLREELKVRNIVVKTVGV